MTPRRAPSAYVGRFAPSPTGPLHAGSLVAALASWLDAQAHGGRWLVRIEDIDPPRCVAGADALILSQLAACGLHAQAPVVWQSQRTEGYETALARLVSSGQAYPCTCTRARIAAHWTAQGRVRERHADGVYPGTCRPGGHSGQGGPDDARAPAAHAWRLKVPLPGDPLGLWHWHDRALGAQTQDLAREVGDFTVRRADGLWAYQLAVVVDDAAQGVTHVVRGQDLTDNTPRQRWLAHCLGLSAPSHLHTPLVLASDGQKLSKQNGAQALDLGDPVRALGHAARTLGLAPPPVPDLPLGDWLAHAVAQWAARHRDTPSAA